MPNDDRICRPYGAWNFRQAVSTKMSLLTELGTPPVRLACTGDSCGPVLYHLLEVIGKLPFQNSGRASLEVALIAHHLGDVALAQSLFQKAYAARHAGFRKHVAKLAKQTGFSVS